MHIILGRVYPPETVTVKFEKDFSMPSQHREILEYLATEDHPLQRLFVEHLHATFAGLKVKFIDAMNFTVECGTWPVGKVAKLIYDGLPVFVRGLWQHERFEHLAGGNFIHKLTLNLTRREHLADFWQD